MKRELTTLAALAASAGPYLPAIAIGSGLVAVLACLLPEAGTKPPAVPAPDKATEPLGLPEAPEPPPDRQPQGRHLSGQFASSITLADLRAVFDAGPLLKADAVAALCRRTHCSRSAAYHVLTRRFASLVEPGEDGRLGFVG